MADLSVFTQLAEVVPDALKMRPLLQRNTNKHVCTLIELEKKNNPIRSLKEKKSVFDKWRFC